MVTFFSKNEYAFFCVWLQSFGIILIFITLMSVINHLSFHKYSTFTYSLTFGFFKALHIMNIVYYESSCKYLCPQFYVDI